MADQPKKEKKAKKVNVHVHMDAAVRSPEHSYMEEVRSPAPVHLEPRAFTDIAAERHAHLDDDVPSPGGMVQRVQTPVSAVGSDEAFEDLEDQELHTPVPETPQPCQCCCRNISLAIVTGAVIVGSVLYITRSRK